MSRLTFIAKYKDSTITYETNNVCLPDILADFQQFLLGAGFVFDGIVEIVNPD